MKTASTSATTAASTVLLGLGLAAGPAGTAGAADLFIAGTIGEVYLGDTETGGFELFGGACLGPIQALAANGSSLYAGDAVGGVLRFDLATGEPLDLFFAPDGISAMVVHDGDLLVSEQSGAIHRMDPATGLVESTLEGPFGIEAMLLLGEDLFVSSALEGIVWKGNPVSGDFQYFGCGCAGPAQGLARVGSSLYAGDAFGQFVRYDLATGALLDEGVLPYDVSAMTADGDDLLLSESGGTVHRIDPVSRVELDALASPIGIEAMLRIEQLTGDLDGDGVVGIGDLLLLLAAWGPCPGSPGECPADLNHDGVVGVADFLLLLANWTV